jgi:predicted transcriptional regulator
MANKSTNPQKGITATFKRPLIYRGVYARVAREFGVSAQFVSQVAHGKKGGKAALEIQRALIREIRRVERAA